MSDNKDSKDPKQSSKIGKIPGYFSNIFTQEQYEKSFSQVVILYDYIELVSGTSSIKSTQYIAPKFGTKYPQSDRVIDPLKKENENTLNVQNAVSYLFIDNGEVYLNHQNKIIHCNINIFKAYSESSDMHSGRGRIYYVSRALFHSINPEFPYLDFVPATQFITSCKDIIRKEYNNDLYSQDSSNWCKPTVFYYYRDLFSYNMKNNYLKPLMNDENYKKTFSITPKKEFNFEIMYSYSANIKLANQAANTTVAEQFNKNKDGQVIECDKSLIIVKRGYPCLVIENRWMQIDKKLIDLFIKNYNSSDFYYTFLSQQSPIMNNKGIFQLDKFRAILYLVVRAIYHTVCKNKNIKSKTTDKFNGIEFIPFDCIENSYKVYPQNSLKLDWYTKIFEIIQAKYKSEFGTDLIDYYLEENKMSKEDSKNDNDDDNWGVIDEEVDDVLTDKKIDAERKARFSVSGIINSDDSDDETPPTKPVVSVDSVNSPYVIPTYIADKVDPVKIYKIQRKSVLYPEFNLNELTNHLVGYVTDEQYNNSFRKALIIYDYGYRLWQLTMEQLRFTKYKIKNKEAKSKSEMPLPTEPYSDPYDFVDMKKTYLVLEKGILYVRSINKVITVPLDFIFFCQLSKKTIEELYVLSCAYLHIETESPINKTIDTIGHKPYYPNDTSNSSCDIVVKNKFENLAETQLNADWCSDAITRYQKELTELINSSANTDKQKSKDGHNKHVKEQLKLFYQKANSGSDA